MQLYEMVFALRPNLDEESINQIKEKIKNFVEKNEGRIEKFDDIGRKKLAYEVEKEEEGYFVRTFFSINSAPVNKMLTWTKSQPELIRTMITKKGVNLLKQQKKETERRGSNVSSE